jgi:predicted amidohydrolase YtcJ
LALHADRIITNAVIISLDPARPRAEALAIRDGRIVGIGAAADLDPLIGPHTIRENAAGKVIIPGLTDAHLHWELTTRWLHSVDLFEVPSRAEAVHRVSAFAAGLPAGQWVTGTGWFQDIWDDRAFPSAADLDAAVPDHPVYLAGKSVHVAWVNTRALQLAGITAETPDPPAGQIGRDSNGQPNGLLFERAMRLVADRIPTQTPEQLADHMLRTQAQAHALGLTGIHDFDDPSCLRALQIQHERGLLGLRVVKQINRPWFQAALDSGLRWNYGDDWIRIGGFKLFADGALGPRTATMIEPYLGEPENYGIVVQPKDEMLEWVSRASTAGLPSTIHAIGDRAVRDVLDVYAIVRAEEAARGEAPASRRHRVEHVQVIHPDDRHRLAELKLIASMQPIHATQDMHMADRYWGARSQWAYNPRLQLDQGVVVAFGSDAPVEHFDPIQGIHAAVTRQRADGSPGPDGWYPVARVSLTEALLAYTQGPAYAAGMEDRLGKLAPLYLADLTVLDRDPYSLPSAELLSLRVHATMVDGRWRFGGL